MFDNEKAYKGLRLSRKQKDFLIALEQVGLNVSIACKKMGISRSTYDEWKAHNDDFRLAVSHIEEAQVDFAETALKKKIQEGDTKAITYFLDNKGKHRGYGQKIDLTALIQNKPTELSHLSDEDLAKLEADLMAKNAAVKGKSKSKPTKKK